MTVIGEALVAVRPKTDRFAPELEAGMKPGLARAEGTTQKSTSRMSGYFKGLVHPAKQAALGIAGGFAAVKIGEGLIDTFRDSIKEAREAQEASDHLANSVSRNKNLTNESTKAFEAQATALQKVTASSDENIQSGQSMLATFNLTQGQILKLTPLVLDYSQKFGVSMPAAAKLFGRAATGNTGALKKLGIEVDKTKAAADPFGTTLDALSKKAGGFAEEQGKTLSGRLAIMHNQFGEAKEQIGNAVLPAFTSFATFMGGTVAPVLQKVIGFVIKHKSVIVPLVLIVATLIAGIKIWTAAQAALNIVMEANPIGIVIVAIAALVVGLIYAYNHSKTFRDIVTGAFKAVSDAVTFMWDFVIKPVFKLWLNLWFTVVGALVHGAASAFGWVPGLGGKLKAAARAFDKFRDDVNTALDGVHRHIKVGIDVELNPVRSGGKGPNRAKANLASGGAVQAGQVLTVGEFGRETFVAPSDGYIVPHNAHSNSDPATLSALAQIAAKLDTVGDQVAGALDSVGARARGQARAQVAW